MQRRFRVSVFVLATIATLAPAVPAFSQSTGRLVVRVTDQNGDAVPDATVTVTCPGGTTLSDATDGSGMATVPGVPAGARCDISVDAVLFEPGRVTTVTVAGGATRDLAVVLQQAGVIVTVCPGAALSAGTRLRNRWMIGTCMDFSRTDWDEFTIVSDTGSFTDLLNGAVVRQREVDNTAAARGDQLWSGTEEAYEFSATLGTM